MAGEFIGKLEEIKKLKEKEERYRVQYKKSIKSFIHLIEILDSSLKNIDSTFVKINWRVKEIENRLQKMEQNEPLSENDKIKKDLNNELKELFISRQTI